MKVLLRHGVTLPHPCHGKGKCGKCHVRISAWDSEGDSVTPDGKVSSLLACQTDIREPIFVHAGPKGSFGAPVAAAADKLAKKKTTSPPFHRVCVFIPQVGESTESQWARLMGGFSGKDALALEEGMETILPMLHDILPPAGGHMTLTRAGKHFFALEAGDATHNRLGMAIVHMNGHLYAALVQLQDGRVLETLAMHVETVPVSGETGIISGKALAVAMNGIVEKACAKSGKKASDITDAVIVGGVEVLHGLTGLNAARAGTRTFTTDRVENISEAGGEHQLPVVLTQRRLRADKLGLRLGRHAGVYLPPAASGRKGSDWVVSGLSSVTESAVSRIHGSIEDLYEKKVMTGALSCLLDGKVRKEAVKRAN